MHENTLIFTVFFITRNNLYYTNDFVEFKNTISCIKSKVVFYFAFQIQENYLGF